MLSCLLALVASGAPWVSGQVLELEVGEERVIRVPGVQRIAVSSVSLYDVKTMGRDEVWFKGFAVGKTTVLLWTNDGTRLTIPLSVVAHRSRPAPVAVTKSKGRAVGADGGVSGSLEVFEFPAELVDVREVGRADGGVHFVGTDRNGSKYDLVLTPRP